MDVSRLSNPYDYANPVSDEGVFAGRLPELSQIATVLEAAGLQKPVGYVAVHGQRSAGKSSMLNMIALMAAERGFLVTRLDLVPTDAGLLPFLSKFYEELVGAVAAMADLGAVNTRRVRRIVAGEVPDDEFPLEFPECLARARNGVPLSEMALREDLAYLAGQAGRPIVVLVDEAQLIADDENVLSLLRTLGMQLRGFVFVLAGTTELIDRIDIVFDHLLRQFEFVEIARYTEASEIEACVVRPLEAAGLNVATCFTNIGEVTNDLAILTDGNPYEIQLYCHTMFSRWRRGAAEGMKLSSEALDEVLAIMDQHRRTREHGLIDAIKDLPLDQLLVLNVLCSAAQKATLAEVLFAHRIYPKGMFASEVIERCRDELVGAKIIEIENGRVRFNGTLFDQIYTRLWTVTKMELNGHHHTQLLSGMGFKALLSRQLESLLCDISADAPTRLLRTCCPGMDPSHLDAGLDALSALRVGERGSFTVDFLHESIVSAGLPGALDVTKVTCTFGATEAVRWITSADVMDFDLETVPHYIQARRQADLLGGRITVERTRQPLPAWPKLRAWLIETADPGSLADLADFHVTSALASFVKNDFGTAAELLQSAHGLVPDWRSANNLAYLRLFEEDFNAAAEWSSRAVTLASSESERALSRYNLAISFLAQGVPDEAEAALRIAKTELKHSFGCTHLLVPSYDKDRKLRLRQETDVELKEMIKVALGVVGARSGEPDAIIGHDEPGGPASS